MESLIVENVRCFRRRQEVPLAPLTILVGENNTGKSTFLALVRLAWDLAAGRLPLDFNEEPFLLGAFSQIATAKRGRAGQAKSFGIGGTFRLNERGRTRRPVAAVAGELSSIDGQPILETYSLSLEDRVIQAELQQGAFVTELHHKRTGSPSEVLTKEANELSWKTPNLHRLLPYVWKSRNVGEVSKEKEFSSAIEPLRRSYDLRNRPYAFAPFRSRPLRTYDPIRDAPGPEGTHVPMLLAQTYKGSAASPSRLRESLESFGKASGLFTALKVRRLGDGSGDPFQLQITIDSLPVNIIDVGYGVSQVLPIVVDCLRGPSDATFLLQQPEVHLHPRAQAELGSLFGALTQTTMRQRFIIETHSDYLVDRIRMDIRDGKTGIGPEDVSLLYFERKNGEVEVARLEIDAQGNIVDPPPGYRRFFLEEERRFLGGW